MILKTKSANWIAKIKTKKIIAVAGLHMVTDRVPTVVLGSLNQSCTQRIQVDIGQTVNQGVTVFHDQALETLPPQGAVPMVALWYRC